MEHQTDNSKNRSATQILISVAAALGFGLIFDILFFGKLPGVSFPLYTLLTLAALLFWARWHRRVLPKSALLMVPLMIFFSAMVFVRASEFLAFVNIVITLYLLGLFTTLTMRPGLRSYNFKDYLSLMIELPITVLGKAAETLKKLVLPKDFLANHKNLPQILRGVLIALPVLLLFLALFSSADLVFREYVSRLFSFDINIDSDTFWQLFWAFLVAAVFAGLFALFGSDEHKRAKHQVARKTISFGMVEMSVLFGSLNVLFFSFIVVQLAYLFGGAANVIGGDFTYAEYARKGFFELLAVAALSFLVIFAAERLLLRDRERHDLRFKVLAGILIAQVLVIMASALKRLNLYENAYGFTSLRLYSFLFIIWLAVVFIFLLHKIFTARRESQFAFAVFATLLVLTAGINFASVDRVVARKNIDRYESTGKLDVRYLETLSDDAVIEITRLLETKDNQLRRTVAAALYERRQDLLDKSKSWQSTNATRAKALQALDKHAQLLEENKNWLDPGYSGPGQR